MEATRSSLSAAPAELEDSLRVRVVPTSPLAQSAEDRSAARYPGPWATTRPCGAPPPPSGRAEREQRALVLGEFPPRPRPGIDTALVSAERRGTFDHMAWQPSPKAWHRALQRPAKLETPYASAKRRNFTGG